MLPSIYDPLEYFAQVNKSTNLVEIISISTGQVVSLLGDLYEIDRAPIEFVEIQTPHGVIKVQKGVSLDHLPINHKMPLSQTLAEVICSHIAEGMGLVKVCHLPGMPSYTTLCKWRRHHEWFATMVNDALKDRSDYIADSIVDIIDSTSVHTPEDLGVLKEKVAALKWTAEKNHPDRYGSKTKVVGDATQPVKIVIETGFREKSDPNFFVDETAKLVGETISLAVAGERKDG